jgi:hypothetical protein
MLFDGTLKLFHSQMFYKSTKFVLNRPQTAMKLEFANPDPFPVDLFRAYDVNVDQVPVSSMRLHFRKTFLFSS